jgi:hypothetical protein
MSEEKALMSTHRYMPNESYERLPLLCYSRAEASPAARQSNIDREHSSVLPGLTILTSLVVLEPLTVQNHPIRLP